jgi:AcrR family transcriptional regulator
MASRTTKTDGLVAPQQERSRASLARLLAATIASLEKQGLEGATVPRIAAAADVAPASIYRRFRDRDALFRAAFMDVLERSEAASDNVLRRASFSEGTFEGVVRRVVTLTLQQYRTNPGLMRALTRFVETDSDEHFRKTATGIIGANFKRLEQVLLTFSEEITHRDKRRAVRFALLMMATVIEVRALEVVSMWHELLPLSDQQITNELTRTMVGYLSAPLEP